MKLLSYWQWQYASCSWLSVGWGGSNSETAGEVPCHDIFTVRQMSLQPVSVSPKAVMAVYSSYKPFPSPSTTKHPHISHTILTEATPWKGRCWGHKEAWEAHRKLTDCQPHPHATSCSAHSMTLGRKRPTQSKAHSSTFLLNQTALPNCSQTEIYILTKTFEMLFIIYKLAQIYLLNLDTVNKIIRDSSTKTFHLSSSFQICMTF